MGKYNELWNYIKENCNEKLVLSFDDIQNILSFPIDHAFLNAKKELVDYGYEVGKISMKNKTVEFNKKN